MKTVKEIKLELAEIKDLKDERLLQHSQDSRISVRKLVNLRIKSIGKLIKLKEEHDKRQIYEKELYQKGFNYIAGLDEVGRGPLAGPLVAAAVILPKDCSNLLGVNDSKSLSAKKRQMFVEKIQETALAIGIAVVDSQTIDQLNIYQATKLGMVKAVENLAIQPDYLLIDAITLDSPIQQKSLVKGDQVSLSIAAASIIAKEFRDQLMKDYHRTYPEFSFDQNVGYGTKDHLAALREYGYTPIHRKSFEPIKSMTIKYKEN